MHYFCFAVKNELTNMFDGIFIYPNDKSAAVDLASAFSRKAGGLDEYSLFRVGSFDLEDAELRPEKPVSIAWDTRRLDKVSE